jgi:hypothetical protein
VGDTACALPRPCQQHHQHNQHQEWSGGSACAGSVCPLRLAAHISTCDMPCPVTPPAATEQSLIITMYLSAAQHVISIIVVQSSLGVPGVLWCRPPLPAAVAMLCATQRWPERMNCNHSDMYSIRGRTVVSTLCMQLLRMLPVDVVSTHACVACVCRLLGGHCVSAGVWLCLPCSRSGGSSGSRTTNLARVAENTYNIGPVKHT